MDSKAPRGRPRSFDREAALERAMELFWRRGYEATSLSELTAAMGIAPPSLYAAFGSKEELFYAAVKRYGAKYGATTVKEFESAPSARAAIERLLRGAAAAYTMPGKPHGCMVISAATNCASSSEEVEAEMRRLRQANEAEIRKRIAQAIEGGELPASTDAHQLAKYFAAVVQGMSVQARDGASREELEALVDFAMAGWPKPERARSVSTRRGTDKR